MINITQLTADHVADTTTITAEIYETVGSLQKVKDKVRIILSGIHTTINDDLMTLVDNEIKNNGL
jgi:hypothetical protein